MLDLLSGVIDESLPVRLRRTRGDGVEDPGDLRGEFVFLIVLLVLEKKDFGFLRFFQLPLLSRAMMLSNPILFFLGV